MRKVLVLIICLSFCIAPAYVKGEEVAYKGVKKCKTCHLNIYKTWNKTKHADAFNKLNEQEKKDPKCIECHTTNNDVNMPGIHCEACHGPGGKFTDPKIMNKKKYKENPELQRKLAIEAGLVIAPNEENCKKCHNERSPHYQGFDFKKRYEEIKHKKDQK
jgi:hypothetical protein